MEAHDCPRCGAFYRPRHANEVFTCWSCSGLSIGDHVSALANRSIASSPRPRLAALLPTQGQNGNAPDLLDALRDLDF